MPELPVLTTPTVEVQGIPGGTSQAHITGQVGRELGQGVLELGKRMQAAQALASADAADLKAADSLSEQQAEFRQLKGNITPAQEKAHIDKMEKTRAEIGAEMSTKFYNSPMSEALYKQQSRRRLEGMIAQSRYHAESERQKYVVGVAKLRHEDVMNRLPDLASDPGKWLELVQEDTAKNDALGQLLNLSGPELEAHLRTMHKDHVNATMDGLLAKDPKEAKRFLDAAIPGFGTPREVIGGVKGKYWDGKIKEIGGKVDGVKAAESVYAKFGTKKEAGDRELHAMYQRGELDETSLPAAQAQYDRSVQAIHVAREQQRVDIYRGVGDLIVKNQPKGKDVTVEAWLAEGDERQRAENAKKWALLDWDQQLNMRAKLAEHNSASAPTPQNNQAYAELIDKEFRGEIDYTKEGGAAKFDAEWGHRLHKSTYANYMNYLHRNAQESDKIPSVSKPVIQTVYAELITKLGIDPKKPRTDAEANMVIEFRNDAIEGAKAWAKESPGVPWPRTAPEGSKAKGYQTVIDKYLIQGAVPGRIWGNTWPTPEMRAQAIVQGREWSYTPTPQEQETILRDFRAANNREPTKAELRIRYDIAGERRGASRVGSAPQAPAPATDEALE